MRSLVNSASTTFSLPASLCNLDAKKLRLVPLLCNVSRFETLTSFLQCEAHHRTKSLLGGFDPVNVICGYRSYTLSGKGIILP